MPFFGTPYGDLEAPGALLTAAASVARTVGKHKELVFMATGPDQNSVSVTNNSLVSLASVGLRKHVMLLADGWQTCQQLQPSIVIGQCFWSSRMLRRPPAESLTIKNFWDYRFRFYYMKKKYMALLVAGGYSVLQADTDTVWVHDPFRMLRLMKDTSIVAMRDVGLANAGVIYARPGSQAAYRLLDEVAWRVQLFQLHPEIVSKIVPFARQPYYANSDDQTLLNDAILSAVVGNRTWLGSTARYEAKNRYNPTAPDWGTQAESKMLASQMHRLWRLQKGGHAVCPWEVPAPGALRKRHRYITLPIGEGDAVALAPRILFAHLPYAPGSAITHLTAARGFGAKVSTLRRIGKWFPLGSQVDIENPPGAAEAGEKEEEALLTLQAASGGKGGGKAGGATKGGPAKRSSFYDGRGGGGGGGGRVIGRGGGGGGGRGASGRGGKTSGKGGGGANKPAISLDTPPALDSSELGPAGATAEAAAPTL